MVEKIPEPLKITKTVDDAHSIEITARDEAHLDQLLTAASRKLRMSPEETAQLRQNAETDAKRVRFHPGGHRGQLSFGGGQSQRSMAKACLALWAEHVGTQEVCIARFDPIRDFINGDAAFDTVRAFGTDTRALPATPDRYDPNPNIIWVGSDQNGTVRGYFRLFNIAGWTFELAAHTAYREQAICLISNPYDPSIWQCDVEAADVLTFDWISTRPRNQDIDWNIPRDRVGHMMQHGVSLQHEREVASITAMAFASAQIEESAVITAEHLSRIAESAS